MNKMERVILGAQARESVDEMDMFVEGRVRSTTPEGAMFVVPNWDGGKHLFGPAPWPKSRVEPKDLGGELGSHDHAATEPPVGSRCVVVFVGAGVDRPWILGWWD